MARKRARSYMPEAAVEKRPRTDASSKTSIKEQNKLKVERIWATKKRIEETKARIEVMKTQLRAYGWTNAQMQYVLETPMEQVVKDQERRRKAAKVTSAEAMAGKNNKDTDAVNEKSLDGASKSGNAKDCLARSETDAEQPGEIVPSTNVDEDSDDDGGVELSV